uniref:hypothetical protein n=1 Tax=Ningiella ruwaisensis TaxID=2364274 RepID=UPI00109F5C84|nr:hypothetical protein [Ningiella ruwaisensis]
MESSMLILAILFSLVLALFVFCLTESHGKNTAHARRENEKKNAAKQVKAEGSKDSISKSYNQRYNVRNNETEAA